MDIRVCKKKIIDKIYIAHPSRYLGSEGLMLDAKTDKICACILVSRTKKEKKKGMVNKQDNNVHFFICNLRRSNDSFKSIEIH